MTEKRLRLLGAYAEQAMGEDLRSSLTGNVSISAIPSWLKGEPVVAASLTPKEARRVAVQLLQAADRAEMVEG